MKIVLTSKHYALGGLGLVVVLVDFMFFFNFTKDVGPAAWYFSPILVLGVLSIGTPFVQDILNEGKRQKEIETKFLEFVRSLVENVRSGVSIPKAIIQVKTSGADFGALQPYITKLANQVEWGYPLHQALTIFANDTKNVVVKRSIAIVMQAEKSGGDMAAVLEAVSGSVLEIKKLKDERKSNAYAQTIQGYIIFFVFVGIMIVMQVYLIPQLTKIGGEVSTGLAGAIGSSTGSGKAADLGPIFLETIVVQGIFAGLMIGKFSEGDFRSGIKHSLIMVVGGYLIMSTITGLVGVTTSGAQVTAGSAAALVLIMRKKWFQRGEI